LGCVLELLISTADGRFPRALLEPRANRMLVMKALRQDVAILAFHPHVALRGLKAHGTALSFVPPKTFCYSRKRFRWDEESQSQRPRCDPAVRIDEGRLKPPFAGNVGIPLAGARRLISRPRKASIFHVRRSKGVPLGYDFGHVELAYKTGIEAANTMIHLCIKKCFSDKHIIVCSKRGGKRIASF